MKKRSIQLCCTAVLTLAFAYAQDGKTILFVGGPKDHGPMGNNRHEYLKDMAVLKYCIDNANLSGVRTRLFNGKAPSMRILSTASAIVVESSGDRTLEETHALFPQDALTDHNTYDGYTTDRLNQFDELMKKGTG